MGYQIVELQAINNLIETQASLDIKISVLLWLISHTKNDLADKQVELDLIKVEYYGPYPALGIKYLVKESIDLEPLVIEICERVLNTFTVSNLLHFINNNYNDVIRYKEKFN